MTRLLMVAGVLVLVLIAAVLLVGYTATGNQFAADQIASRISTPDTQVSIEGARGLLAGRFRVDRVELADTKGKYAELKDIEVDWSPLDLLGAEFHAQRIAAADVSVERPPVVTLEPEPAASEGSFSLPVEIAVDAIELPSIALGKPLIGRNTKLALKGSARAAADTIALELDASQADRPDARAVADIAYAVNTNTLKLDLKVTEPKAGLLATALQLPGGPAIDLTVNGDGALSDWAGVVRARLDGVERIAVNASHRLGASGMHDVNLNGGGAIGDLMPPTFRSLFEGETAIDVDASFDGAGHLDIRSGKLANGSFTLDASGAVDPKGEVNINGSLRSVAEVIPVRWPLAEGELRADIRNASFVASGPYGAVAINLSTDIAALALPQGRLTDVFLRAESDALDLANRTGRVAVELTSQGTDFNDPQLAKLVRAPIEIKAPFEITPTSVTSEAIEISSGALGGKLTLDFARDTGVIGSDFNLFLAPAQVLPEKLASRITNTIKLSGKVSGTPDDLAFEKLQLASNILTAEVSGTLRAGELDASLTGDVPSLSAFQPDVAGELRLVADVTGPLSNLAVKTAIASEEIAAEGRKLQTVDLRFDGGLDPAKPGGRLTLAAMIDGQQVNLAADVIRENGLINLPSINADIGRNTLTGSLTLGADFLPSGKLNADLAELATLARLANQQAEGDLKLAVDLNSTGGAITAVIDGTGTRLAAGTAVLNEPVIHVESTDLLTQRVAGIVKSRDIAAGANRLEAVELAFEHEPASTAFDLKSRYDGALLTAKGAIDQQPGGLVLRLSEFAAAPRNIPVSLAQPAVVKVTEDTAAIDALTIAAGSGTVVLDGTAGRRLDLRIDAKALPANLANGLAPELDAAGTLDAKATVTGDATAPVIAFEAAGTDLTAKPLRDAGRQPLQISAKGTFTNALLSTTAEVAGIAELGRANLDTAIRLGDEIRIEKFALNSDGLDGTVTGTFAPSTRAIALLLDAEVTGSRLIPPVIATKLNGALKLTGRLGGTPDDLSFDAIKVTSNLLTADASGTFKSGVLQVNATGAIPDIAAFDPNASGAVQFTGEVGGPTSALSIKAAVTSAEAMLARRALKNLSVNLDGQLEPAGPSAKLTATGTIDGQAINVAGDVVSKDGRISIPALKADVGRNTLSATFALSEAFRPTGNVTFDLPDLGLLAALAGQQATGDLKGRADIAETAGRIGVNIKASGTGVAAQGLTIRNPTVDLDIPDLLTGQISGTVTAAELAADSNRLVNLDAEFKLEGDRTDFTVDGNLDDAPLRVSGAVTRRDSGLEIALAQLSATPRKIPLRLAAPATITIANGITDLGEMQLGIGDGTVRASGTIGETLNLSVTATDFPARIANTFAPELGADGAVTANATVAGTPALPSVAFDVAAKGLIVNQMRNAALQPVDIASKGTFENSILNAETTIDGIEKLGQTRLVSELALEGNTISLRRLDIAGERLNGILKADYATDTQALDASFDLSAVAEGLLPPDIAAKVKGLVQLAGKIKGVLPSDITISELKLSSNVLTADGTATLKGAELQAKISGDILDIAAFHPNASGKAHFQADATGPLAALKVKAALTTPEAVLASRPLRNLDLKIDGVADPKNPNGRVTATGTLDNQRIDVAADLVSKDGRLSVPALRADVGRNSLTGAIELSEAFLPSGSLKFDFPDIGLLAALGGQTASGDIAGQIDLTNTDGRIAAKLKAEGTGIVAQGITLKRPAVDLDAPDVLSGRISGTARAQEIASGQNRLVDLDARFTQSGARTDFDIKGNFDGAPLTANGAVERGAEGLSVSLANFAASPRRIPVRLSSPVTIRMVGGAADISNLTIATGRGTITVNGTAGERLDLKVKVAALPATLANTFAAGLNAGGTISANATVSGTSSNPAVNFDLTWQNAMTSQIRAAGVSALNVTAKGKLQNSVLSIDTNVRGGGGLTLRANGTVGTSGSQALNLNVRGRLPFSAIAAQLAAQGLALTGNADFDLRIGGNAANPAISGRITTAGSRFIAIRQNIVVNRLSATVTLSAQTATITNLEGRIEGGGRVSASGTVGIRPGSNFPANITVKLDNAVYADGRVVAAKLDGDLNVRGPLLGEATLGGSIRLRRADITVPERLPASLANANVKHVNAPAAIIRQSRELRADSSAAVDEAPSGGTRLSLKISAPRKVFVRGRGLDAELGGEVLISGSSAAPGVSGGFRMRRGRLSIIGRRLDFTTGQITFGGGLVPHLNMVASTTVNARTLRVNVVGLANNPDFSFTSSPALPQDEVLAQLIFGRESSSLSPFQIAQLADAAATLSGGQRTSLFNRLRQGLGVDDLNVGTDENGGAQVTAGKYINKRTYLEVMQGQDPSKSGVAINLDIGKGVKLRGQATQDGGTATGVFFEKEY